MHKYPTACNVRLSGCGRGRNGDGFCFARIGLAHFQKCSAPGQGFRPHHAKEIKRGSFSAEGGFWFGLLDLRGKD